MVTKPVPLTGKPFESLKSILPAVPSHAKAKAEAKQATRKEQHTEMVKPNYLVKLADVVGGFNEVGRQIGYSGPAISEGVRNESCPLRMELAAEGMYRRKFERPVVEAAPLMQDGDVFVSMKIDAAALKAIEQWLKDAGADVKVF